MSNLVNYREWVIRLWFWPGIIRLSVQEGDDVFSILGEVLWPIVQQREDVIGGVPRVDTVLISGVTESSRPLLKVPLFTRFDVVHVDLNEVVSVRPRVLVHKPEGVQKLVDWRHQAQVETATEIGNKIWNEHLSSCFRGFVSPVQFKLLLPPNPSQVAPAHPGCVPDENIVLR